MEGEALRQALNKQRERITTAIQPITPHEAMEIVYKFLATCDEESAEHNKEWMRDQLR